VSSYFSSFLLTDLTIYDDDDDDDDDDDYNGNNYGFIIADSNLMEERLLCPITPTPNTAGIRSLSVSHYIPLNDLVTRDHSLSLSIHTSLKFSFFCIFLFVFIASSELSRIHI
jgi:hypothetical protein